VTPTKGLCNVLSPCMMSPPLLIPENFRFRHIFLILVSEVNHELAPTFETCITPLEKFEEPLNLSLIPKSKRKKCDHEGVRHF
jgi:hypothetical protein